MASTVQAPPPRRQSRSFAGPVVLIVIGIALLLANMGVLHWYTLASLFAKYWPVLIIIWGVIKLLEYQSAQRAGLRPRGIGAGRSFVLILLIVCGLAATQASRFNWGALRDEVDINGGDFPFFGKSFSYDDQMQQSFPAGATLHVVNDHGAINVNTSEDNQIHVVVHKRISAEKQEDADKWNTATKPQITTSDRVVTLNANTQGAGDHWVNTDLDISVPRKAAVTASTRRGDVNVMGRDGNVDITSQHGDVSVVDINGKVSLNLERSSARVSQIASDVSIEGRVNDVSVQDVKGAVRLNGEFMESVKLARVAGTVAFKSSRTDMEMAKLGGDLDLDSGDLRASDVGGPLRLTTRSKDIRLDGVSGEVRLQDSNGSVELHMVKLGNVQVENRKGDIDLYVPAKASFQVDARARGGDIESDFPELKVENAHETATASGVVGGEGPRIVITNEHGTVSIRKGSVVTEAPPAPAPPKAPRLPSREQEVQPTEQ